MTCKEAFKKVLAHQGVTPVPWSIKFTVEAKARYEAYLGKKIDPIRDLGSYVVASHTNNGWAEVEPGFFRDHFGVVWNKTQDKTLGIVDNPPLKEASFSGYHFPNPDANPVFGFIDADRKKYPDCFHMVSIGFALFERAWALCGMENLFDHLVNEPEFTHDLLDRVTEYNLGVIERAARQGVDCVHLGDDWGSQKSCLISPAMWREFIAPCYRRTCLRAKELGLIVSLHCCGNVEAIMEDILACGTDVFDPFQPEAMDIWALREKFRGRMSFWGGLSVQQTFPFGSPEDVRREGRGLLARMAPGGGYILAPAHSLTGDIPPENIAAFIELARNQ